MNLVAWLKVAAVAVGVLALCVLIGFGGPLIAIGEFRPLESELVRLAIMLIIIAVAGVLIGLWIRKRLKASAALAEAMTAEQEVGSDAPALRDAMKDALATLRRSHGAGGGDYLYDLPWYVIIGPPGSGKTTALINSGLKFPLSRGTTPEAIAGIGGTRYCDWWFTEDAVFVDTAGRYTTQDSDAKTDRSSWISFLDLLKTNRPKQPINGVMVAISVEDLLAGTPEMIEAHATAIRKRLLELHEHLKVDYPVYALFTKTDLVAGFNEFFGAMGEVDRQKVWGHTFQTADKTKNMVGEVAVEIDALIERLNEHLTDRLQEEPNPASRVIGFGFSSQVAALKRPVVDFLTKIFEPTRYHANATLRGFYFTSGTQKGTPIDQLIGTLAKNFGAEEMGAGAYSGLGKSFFLTDLIRKVIVGESGWVSTDRGAVRRMALIRAGAFAAVAAVCVAASVLWTISYSRNSDLILATTTALADYRGAAAPVIAETIITERDLGKVVNHLQKLRNMPAGFSQMETPTPVLSTLGLSQRERLESASVTTYEIGLERLFRSRLIYRLEEQLEANITNPGFVYEALKVYLMVGGRARVDKDLVVAWMRQDWADNLFAGAANARGRERLEEHLVAMLDLNPSGEVQVQLNQALIETAQRTLARMSVAQRAYELLRSQARGLTQKDWVAAYRGGPDMKLVFEGNNGEDLEQIRVPYFFTYEGFHNAFLDRLGDIGERIERERWVLGEAGEQRDVVQQYATLYRDLLALYTKDFVAIWQQTMARLRLRPLNADKPRYVALSAISAATSPFKQVLESVREETQLTKERADIKKEGAGAGAPNATVEKSKSIVKEGVRDAARDAVQGGIGRVSSTAGSIAGRIIGNLPLNAPGVDPVAGGGLEAPGANIEAQFKVFHVLVEGGLGQRPVDQLLQVFSEINQNLQIAVTNPAEQPATNAALVRLIANLRANSSRYPPPFDRMVVAAANNFEGDATDAIVAAIRQGLADQVTRRCQEVVTNRYPFIKGSPREVPLADFANLFAPNAIMDKFLKERLEPYVDQSKAQWAYRVDSRVARALSPTTLREFQRARDIRDAFFPTGGNLPSFQMFVTPTALSGDAQSAKFEINGFTVASQQGVNTPTPITWPGGGARTAITLTLASTAPGGGGGLFGGGFFGGGQQPQQQAPTGAEDKLYEAQGVWSLFRLLDDGSTLRQGDNILLTFARRGRQVGYAFSVQALKNPLLVSTLRDFKCPGGI